MLARPLFCMMILLPFGSPAAAPALDVQSIIQRSVAATEQDFASAPQYSFREQDHHGESSKTYEISMISGSPYRRLIAVDGRAIPTAEARKQQHLMEKAVTHRRAESREERANRIAQYEKGQKRDRVMMRQLVEAFDFASQGQTRLGSYDVYVLKASPKRGYHPPNYEAAVLTGMQGTLWVDTRTFQWVKVEAHVIHPVSIDGFLARVEPGTRFELEKAPVPGGVWLPIHFAMQSHARVLDIFPHGHAEDVTYSDYKRTGPEEAKAGSENRPH